MYDSKGENKEGDKKSKMSTKFRCVADSDQDKLLNPGHY